MNTKPIYVFATWQVKEGQLNTVLTLLHDVAMESRKEKGNLFYNIHQNITNANEIVLAEGYSNETAVEDHRNTSHFQNIVIGKIIPLLEDRKVVLTNIHVV